MARINAYTKDGSIQGSERLLGSDQDGSTKTFTINDVKDFLIAQGVSGAVGYQFDNTVGDNDLGSGGFSANSTTFSSVTKITIHNSYIGGSDVTNYLNTFAGQEVLIYNIKDRNNFARYVFSGTFVNNPNNSDLKDVDVTYRSSNGDFINGEFYAFGFEGKDRHYTHHQVNASASWVINHNLNKFPSVSIKFSSSDTIYTNVGALAGVVYTDKNNLTINLVSSESGYAYLN
mgnify:CR=1 FL=1